MGEVKGGNYISGDHMNQFGKTLERNTCFRYVRVSFIQHSSLISSMSTPHIYKLQVPFSRKTFKVLLATIV